MSIKKKPLKTKPVCKVTFKVPKSIANGAKHIFVTGDFNDWDRGAHPMKTLKSGDFTTTVNLQNGREYQFRYLIDGDKWENDPEADKYVTNPLGNATNSVVVI